MTTGDLDLEGHDGALNVRGIIGTDVSIVLVDLPDGSTHEGSAKRHPTDEPDPAVAHDLAFGRSLIAAGTYLEERGKTRSEDNVRRKDFVDKLVRGDYTEQLVDALAPVIQHEILTAVLQNALLEDIVTFEQAQEILTTGLTDAEHFWLIAAIYAQHIENYEQAQVAADKACTIEIDLMELEAQLDGISNDEDKIRIGNEINGKLRRCRVQLADLHGKINPTEYSVLQERLVALTDRVLTEVFGFSNAESVRAQEDWDQRSVQASSEAPSEAPSSITNNVFVGEPSKHAKRDAKRDAKRTAKQAKKINRAALRGSAGKK